MGQVHSNLHLAVSDKPLRMIADVCQVSKVVNVKVDPSLRESFGEVKGSVLKGRNNLAHYIVRASAISTSNRVFQRLPEGLLNLVSHFEHLSLNKDSDSESKFLAPGSNFQPENVISLLGASAVEQAEVDHILEYDEKTLVPALNSGDDEKKTAVLHELASKLSSKTFLVEPQLTLGDLVLYSSLYSTVASMVAKQTPIIPDIVRYFDMTQQIVLCEYAKLNLEPVFEHIDIDFEAVPFAPHTPPVKPKKKAPTAEASSGKTKDAKSEGKAAAKKEKKVPASSPTPAVIMDPSCLHMVVARVESVERHPDADALYVEQMDLGFEKRTVISGLVKHLKEDQLLGKEVILLANLKPAKMRGIESQAMVLCATDRESGRLELVQPPPGTAIGSVIYVEGYEPQKDSIGQLNPKKKQFETIQPNFTTTKSLEVAYVVPEGFENAGKVFKFINEKGEPCKVESIVNASIK